MSTADKLDTKDEHSDEQIDAVIFALRSAWQANRHWRFGQLVANASIAAENRYDPYYVDNSKLAFALMSFAVIPSDPKENV